jgi:excisionase family DNA binding protein
VSLKQAAFLLGVKEPTIRKHMRQGTIPRVRVGKRVLVPMKAINDLVLKGAWSVENGEKK